MTLLEVNELSVSFPTSDGVVQAVRGLSFEVEAGKTLGIVGESGSGKSVSVLTMLGLSLGADIAGSVRFEGRELIGLSQDEIRSLRGSEISMIFQDPLSSLHPHYRVGWQIAEADRTLRSVSKAEGRKRAIELLQLVHIPQADQRVDAYPHELSGGMRQRVMIAMALASRPKLLIADEPTTALDATVQAQIMELLAELQRSLGMALIIITHDLGVIASVADRVLVMYAGRAAEKSGLRSLFYEAHHPYTRGLLRSVPAATGVRGRLLPIVGQPPSLIHPPGGCAFNPRCPFAMPRCRAEQPPLVSIPDAPNHLSACWLPRELHGTGDVVDDRRARYADEHRMTQEATPIG
ncbi:MAG TPA: ABC transporter ATP-binding protein [Acidimicrobiales bacterium]|nr:ABC transporter ATP-binding protein [Acidimicrobiales bacterium]